MLTAGRARWHSGSRGDAMTTTLRATIPGPAGHPILGMGPAFRRDPLCCMLDGFREYGDLVAYPFGPRRGPLRRVAVAAYHPDYVHQVLTTTGPAFGRQTVGFSTLAEVLGRGLLTTEGEVWRRQRRTLQPLFTRRRVAGYTELMCAEAERAVAEGAGGAAVDLHALMQRYALRVVGRALFGEDIEEIIGELQPLVPALSDLVMQRTTQVMRMPLDWPTLRNRPHQRPGPVRAGAAQARRLPGDHAPAVRCERRRAGRALPVQCRGRPGGRRQAARPGRDRHDVRLRPDGPRRHPGRADQRAVRTRRRVGGRLRRLAADGLHRPAADHRAATGARDVDRRRAGARRRDQRRPGAAFGVRLPPGAGRARLDRPGPGIATGPARP